MSLLAKLIEAGTPAELIEEVAMLMAEKRAAEKAIEAKREKDRERQARKRERDVQSRDVTECHVTERDKRDPSLSRPLSPQTPLTPTHTHPEYNTRTRKGASLARPEGVSEQVWSDFLAHRKAKRAPVSQTVIDGIRREAEKAGWTLEAAMAESVAQGWQGFKAEWILRDKGFVRTVQTPADVDPLLASIRAKRAAMAPP